MPALPENCRGCVYYLAPESRCHRHSPSPGEAVPGQYLFSSWTEVSPDDRCGSGADVRKPDDAALIACVDCVYWWQPGGVGLQPKFLAGRTREWWSRTGYCTANAPYPSSDPRRKAAWPVKHASECCGDGLHVADAVGDAEDDLAEFAAGETPQVSDEDEAAAARTALARNLFEARERRSMSQADLAAAAGISQQKVSAIEQGTENVTVRTVGRLARALGVTVDALFRRSGKM